MDNTEMIEELRKNADITYKTASEILAGVKWDMDAAKTALKKEGIYKEEETAMITTDNYTKNTAGTSEKNFKSSAKSAGRWLRDKIGRGMHNDFVITSKNGRRFSLPVTITVILTIAGIEIVPLALIIAFFCGCRFSFNGPDLGTSKINDEMSNIRFSYSGNNAE